jgi:hypothetical protein
MVAPLSLAPVLSPQFYTPYVVALTITKKAISLSGGNFIVTGVNGAAWMKVTRGLRCHNYVRGYRSLVRIFFRKYMYI